jgi:lysozyme
MFKMNKKGIDLIKHFEGCHLTGYLCPANVPTIGYGTTVYPDGTAVRVGDRITQSQADEYLELDLKNKYEKHVKDSNIYEKLKNHNEFSALVSFVYNVGRGGIHLPNSIFRRIANGEDYKKVVSEELPRWVHGGGGRLAGLVRRREAELELFFSKVGQEDNDLEIKLNEVSGKVEQYQKDLNTWLGTWGKPTLSADGIFGQLSLAASNDFARNNKEMENERGVPSSVYTKVKTFARNVSPDKPKYNEPVESRIFVRGEDVQLSSNFHLSEFTCKCGRCRNQPIDMQMVRKLQELREVMGVPLYITSAYRCPTHNRNVGGASQSRHMVGDAVDISVGNLNWRVLIAEAKRLGFTGIGYGQHRGFIHLDTRPHSAEWNYQ